MTSPTQQRELEQRLKRLKARSATIKFAVGDGAITAAMAMEIERLERVLAWPPKK